MMNLNNNLSFDKIHLEPDVEAFNGVFLNQESYMLLLKLSDTYFGLNMSTQDRVLPCLNNCYMLISRSYVHLTKGVGKKASLTVNRLLYNKHFGVLVAMVQMKNNFTCNPIPHIVISKRETMSNVTVSRIVNGEEANEFPSVIETLYEPVKVHGRIGIMMGSEETKQPNTVNINGMIVTQTNQRVVRPEVAYTVEQSAPNKFLTFDQFKERAKSTKKEDTDDTMKITIEPKNTDDVTTGETFRGEPVMQGPRGGKYIIKDGKKVYVKDKAKAEGSDVVYKINILENEQ